MKYDDMSTPTVRIQQLCSLSLLYSVFNKDSYLLQPVFQIKRKKKIPEEYSANTKYLKEYREV